MRKHDTKNQNTHFGLPQLRRDISKLYSHLEEQIENVSSTIKATFDGLGFGEEQQDEQMHVSLLKSA